MSAQEIITQLETLTPAELTQVRDRLEALTSKTEELERKTAGQILLEFAGTFSGLPPDASINHDHYLYGAPKREA